MESMVVTRGEVDDTEEKGISRLDASSRGTSSTFDRRASPHLGRDFDRFE